MKYLILITISISLSVQAGAQAVRASTRTMASAGVEEIEVQPLMSDVARWQQEYGVDLYAYPVELDILLSEDERHLSFADAGTVTLMIESEEALYSNEVVIRTTAGSRAYRIPAGSRRMLVPVVGKFAISTNGAGNLRLTKCYIEPLEVSESHDFGFGESNPCHPNASCDEVQDWADQARSVMRIRMALEEGLGWCSGTLVNNTTLDGTPYILTAEHCLGDYTPYFDMWAFDFNYQGNTCENPMDEPEYETLTGCVTRAKNRDTDFMLLELDHEVPVYFNAYFSGWDRRDTVEPSKAALIHHPSGDIKKISRDLNTVKIWAQVLEWDEGYTTPANTHWRNKFDFGAFEGGSSGGGLYNPNGYLIGQLHGGSGDCFANNGYSGALYASWDYGASEESLREWLDPTLNDVQVLDGMEHPNQGNVYELTGTVKDHKGNAVTGTTIQLSGDMGLAFEVDTNGQFEIPQVVRPDSIVFTPIKPGVDPKNGISAIDLLLIQKHLIGLQPFEYEFQEQAADATGNGEVTAGDILILQKLLLGQVPVLPSQDSWTFSPSSITLMNPQDSVVQIEFQAIKTGDVNASANPNE